MGACCCKSVAAVNPQGLDGELPIPVKVPNGASGGGAPGPNTLSPNVLKLLRISMQPSDSEEDASTPKLHSDANSQPESINSESAVKVAVLVRPLLPMEQGDADVLQSLGQGRLQATAKDRSTSYSFAYDAVYRMAGPQDQKDMYKALGMRVVERVCQGFNGGILAYGQTGSGKTYNMGTAHSMAEALKPGCTTAAGVLPAVIRSLWAYIQAAQKQYNITVKVTYIEIYNEAVQDLLRGYKPSRPGALVTWMKPDAKPDIRENAAGEVVVDGVTQVLVASPDELAAAADYASSCRVTGAHRMNEQSSRSHAILILTMEQRASPAAMQQLPGELHYLRSHLHLVDLAGSERVKETQAQGLRFQEGVSINKGLLELGNVISALAEGGGKRKHVPYRNSKLTRVLQDCLGGNAETLMLACVSPASSNYEQTLNTLRYAQRARAIRNQLCLNNKPQSLEEENAYLREQLQLLQAENARLQEQLAKHQ